MTHAQKSTLYDLLKAASDSLYGFSSPTFPRERPNLLDDEPQTKPADSPRPAESAAPAAASPDADVRKPARTTAEKLSSLAGKISACSRCPLRERRTNAVPGEGAESPLVLVVGEGPGEQEDITGRPFVGAAGQMLDRMLGSIGLSRRTNCYIANVVKCRPPRNRTPLPAEAEACRSFLDAQIAILKPRAILAAGSTAVKSLLRTGAGVVKLHGQELSLDGIPLVATYHPSALLRYPENKRTAWEDLKAFRSLLRRIEPGYEQAGAEGGE